MRRQGRKDVGTYQGGCPRSTTGPGWQRLCIEQVFERGPRHGVEMRQCRYEIAKCFKYVTFKSLRNIIYIYLYYINIIYRI